VSRSMKRLIRASTLSLLFVCAGIHLSARASSARADSGTHNAAERFRLVVAGAIFRQRRE
jgi:hypothetical protein